MAYLAQEVHNFKEVKRRLIQEIPSIEEDQDCLADTLAGLTSLNEILEQCAISKLQDDAIAKGIGEVIKKLQARKKRYEVRSSKTKDLILEAMLETGVKKVAGALTISISKGRPFLVIIDETEIPDEFLITETKPDNGRIKAELEAGELVNGATLSNGKPCVQIRT